MKNFLTVFFFMILFINPGFSQNYLQKGKIYIGPSIGYFYGLGFGAQGEYGISDKFGAGADIIYDNLSFNGDDYKMTAALASCIYHWSPRKPFDLFIKLGLGYYHFGISSGTETTSYATGVGIAGQVGLRYFLSNKLALRAAFGYPLFFSTGVDFAITK